MTKRKALGRGLDVLLSTGVEGQGPNTSGEKLRYLPIDIMSRGPWQPRQNIDPKSLEELADSIRAHGVIQPIIVKPMEETSAGDERFEIIAGERRWRAAQAAGLHEIPAIIHEVADDTALALALIENIQRDDLSPVEEARAVARLINDHNMTHQMVAEAIGRSRSSVTNLLRLLELSPPVLARLEEGELDMGHARALRALEEEGQITAALEVISKQLNARQTEALVRRLKREQNAGMDEAQSRKTHTQGCDPNIKRLEHELSDQFGTLVIIKAHVKGKGELIIRYDSLAQFDGLLERLRGKPEQ